MGLPIIVIQLKEYQESLNDTIIKKIKKGVDNIESFIRFFLGEQFCIINTKAEIDNRYAKLRNLPPEGMVDNKLAKPKNRKIKLSKRKYPLSKNINFFL